MGRTCRWRYLRSKHLRMIQPVRKSPIHPVRIHLGRRIVPHGILNAFHSHHLWSIPEQDGKCGHHRCIHCYRHTRISSSGRCSYTKRADHRCLPHLGKILPSPHKCSHLHRSQDYKHNRNGTVVRSIHSSLVDYSGFLHHMMAGAVHRVEFQPNDKFGQTNIRSGCNQLDKCIPEQCRMVLSHLKCFENYAL